MFGYIRPKNAELKVRESEYYRAVYCGLCHAMRHVTGAFSRVTLSYDFVFLAIVRMGLIGEVPAFEQKRCFVHPTRKRPTACENETLRYCAGAAALLSYGKCRDDLHDETGLRRLGAWLLLPFLAHARRRALKKIAGLSVLEEQIAACLAEIAAIEAAMEENRRPKGTRPSPDTPSGTPHEPAAPSPDAPSGTPYEPAAPSPDTPSGTPHEPAAPSPDAPSGHPHEPAAPSPDTPSGTPHEPAMSSPDAPSGTPYEPAAPSPDTPSGTPYEPAAPSPDTPRGHPHEPAMSSPDDLPSADRPAAVCGRLLGAVLSFGLPEKERRIAAPIGRAIGHWIYLADAADDFDEDARRGRFNALRAVYGDDFDKARREQVRVAMIATLMEAEPALALVPFDEDPDAAGIVRNTFFLGLPAVAEHILFPRGKGKGKGKVPSGKTSENQQKK